MITEDFSTFLQELSNNNHKDWFKAHKKHYENDVKTPFLNLLEELLPSLCEWDPRILPDPKKALFRINKDVRFSKDKTPYHTIVKAGFSPYGKKSFLPGYYLGIDAINIHVGGGLFMLRGPELKKVREHMLYNPEELIQIVEATNFVQNFGRLKGEKAKRLDKNFLSVAKKTDLIYHKQFYAMAEFPLEPFYGGNGLLEEIMVHFEAIKPLNTYLNQAFD
ncbi:MULTISPECIES: DUF2461 domain-containing protein [Flavobacteriaceae]|uniref:DUF2461 domain-containing protein n=1 Tax=Flavobacteriaceae TaxID=49546 RepID=UPI001492A81C|nr:MULTISPECIES: DUF2461 domain-containing protein [Allomuricauda]MDC6366466.1 DUF2461 domain-containing protein [Muricauda sp. AC10]